MQSNLWDGCCRRHDCFMDEDTNTKHRVSFSTDSIGPQQPRDQVLSLFTELRVEKTQGLFKVYIENRFNNNIVVYGNVLL